VECVKGNAERKNEVEQGQVRRSAKMPDEIRRRLDKEVEILEEPG
jgi:hypothetical protein